VADGARTHDNWNHNPGLYQLSYSHHREIDIGLPDRNRTCNPQLRRLVLYPVELRADKLHDEIMKGKPEELVGVERFELPTSCSQSRRATRLRYTPKTEIYRKSDFWSIPIC
jgi:hypothetical protein